MTKKLITVMLSVMMLVSCMSFVTVSAADVTLSGADFKAMLDNVNSYMTGDGKTQEDRERIYDVLEVYTATDLGMDALIGLAADPSGAQLELFERYITAFFGQGDDASKAQAQEMLKLLLSLLKSVPEATRATAMGQWHDRVQYADYATLDDEVKTGTEQLYNYWLGSSAYKDDGVTEAVLYNLLYNLRDLVVFTADVDDLNFDYKFYAFTNATVKRNIENWVVANFPVITVRNETSEAIYNVTSAEQFMGILCDIINADTYFTPQIKKDIAAALYKVNSFVYGSSATALNITAENAALLTQTQGSVQPVTINLTATLTNSTAENGKPTVAIPAVEWYVNGTLVQTGGTSLVYTPSAVGTYAVVAKSGNLSSNSLTITVNASAGTVVTPSQPSTGTGSTTGGNISSGSGSGVGSGGGTINIGSGDVSSANPNAYPAIPAPSAVGFVTQDNHTTAISSQTVTFEDTQGHWSEDYVEVLATAGFLHGRSSTQYAPDFGVTREEMAVILARVLGEEGVKPTSVVEFSDHNSIQDYAKDAVYRMVEMGIYKGYAEGHFGPQQVLTREEIAALFSRIMGQAGITWDVAFGDHHEIAEWFVADVENLVHYGIVNGYPDNSFRPAKDVTRAEAAVMLFNTLYRLGILK